MQLKTSIVGTAFLLAIALPTLAQDGTMTPSNNMPPVTGTLGEMVQQLRMREMQPTMAPGMAPSNGMMAPSSPMMAMSAQDQLFMVRAAEGNLAEITAAQMAVEKSKTPGVKNVAQTIITGHTQAQNDLMALATRKGMMMKPMPMLSPTHMAVGMSLRKSKGAEFDKTYMSNQTDDHENTIALFQAEIEGGQDADLKAYAQKYLPDIVGHTIMIYTVAKQVMAPGSEMRPAMPPVPAGVTPTMMPMDGMGMGSGSGSGMAPMN